MGVDLSSTETSMSQKFLDAAKVSPAIKHVSGEGVSKRMWADGWVQIGLGQIFIELSADTSSAESLSGLVHEQGLLGGVVGFLELLAFGEVFCNDFKSFGSGRGQTFSSSFSPDVKDTLIKIDVGDIQSHQLGDANPGGVDDLKHGQVSQTQKGGSVWGFEEGFDLVLFEELGQAFFLLGSSDDRDWAGLQISPADQEFIERSQSSQLSGGSGACVVFVVEDYEKFSNGGRGHCQYLGSDLQS